MLEHIIVILLALLCILAFCIVWWTYRTYSSPKGISLIGEFQISDLQKPIKNAALVKTYIGIGKALKIQTKHISHYSVLICAENFAMILSPKARGIEFIRIEQQDNYTRYYAKDSLKTLDGDYYYISKIFKFKEPVTVIEFLNYASKYASNREFSFFKDNCQRTVIECLLHFKPTIDVSKEWEPSRLNLIKTGIYELFFDKNVFVENKWVRDIKDRLIDRGWLPEKNNKK